MYILFTDETNLPTDPKAKFFGYGGLFLDVAKLPELDARIEKIRQQNGYKAADELKFETNAKPAHVSVAQARVAKEQVIQACIDIGATFIVEVVLNDLARNQSHDDLIKFGANEVIAAFNIWLRAHGEYGIVIVDRLASVSEYKYLAEKFCSGLTLQSGETMQLERVKLFASSCINASHAASAVDIVLGAARYCVNEPSNVTAAKKMITQIVKLLWHEVKNGQIAAYGYLPRPKNIKSAKYQAEYDNLLNRINQLLQGT